MAKANGPDRRETVEAHVARRQRRLQGGREDASWEATRMDSPRLDLVILVLLAVVILLALVLVLLRMDRRQ